MASAADADLILRLYELRREPRMRAARNWVVHEFAPETLDDLLEVQRDFGSEHNQYWRQVISYWEMAAAFVLRGALDGDLFFDSVGEIIFLQAKFGRFQQEFAERSGSPGFMPNSAELVERFPQARQRRDALRAFLEAKRKS